MNMKETQQVMENSYWTTTTTVGDVEVIYELIKK